MVGKDSGCVRVEFGLPRHLHADTFGGEVEPSDAGEQGTDLHAAPFQARPRMMCCMCLGWTPYSSASCAWVTPPASQRARISRTWAGVSLERLGGRYLTGCGVRARSRFARARRTSWYASTRAMTSRLVCAVRHAWSRRSWALARRRSMSRIGTERQAMSLMPTASDRGSARRAWRHRPL